MTGEDGSTHRHDRDEGIRYDATLEGIGAVKLIREGGKISAANASQICDGASGVLVVDEAALKAHGLTPLARIHNLTVTAGDPVIMLEEPIPATEAGARARRHEDRRHRPLRGQRSLRPGAAGLAHARPAPIPTGSTSMAARSRLAIRSARRAPS